MVRIKWIDGKETRFHTVVKAEPVSPELIVLKDADDKICYYVSIKEIRYVSID